MAVDRSLWKKNFDNFPSWPCPHCQQSSLYLLSDSLRIMETGFSVDARVAMPWTPEWIDEKFSALLMCSNSTCKEAVSVGGIRFHYEDHDWETQTENWSKSFEPKYFFPAPRIFFINESCPEKIQVERDRAFSLYWYDISSSANCLRSACEALLTEKKIQRFTVNKKGKKEQISLHSRILIFGQKDTLAASYLLAIKWLGNAGSHASDKLKPTDLLDGFELFERVVEQVYIKKEKSLTRLAKSINKRKGPLLVKPKSK